MSNAKLFKNSTVYAIVQILQKASGLLLLLIYTRILAPEEKGISDLVLALVSFYAVFYTLSLNSAIVRYYVDYKENEKKLKEFWGTCITFILINSFALTFILCIFNKFLIVPFAKNVEFFPYIFLGLISITLNPIFTVYQSTLQARECSNEYAKNNMAYFLVNISLNIVFIIILRIGAVGILLSLAITDLIFFIFTMIKFVKNIKLTIKIKYLLKALKYSLPLLPHVLSGWIMALIDRIFIGQFINVASVSIYSTAAQFGNVINVLTGAVNQAYVPWFFNKMKDKEKNDQEIIKIAEIIIVGYCLIAMGMSLFGPEIFRILGKKYYSGWKLIPIISFTYVIGGLYNFFVNPLFYNKRGVKFIAIGTFTGAILNMILNIFLIQKFSVMGAAVASMLSNIITCLLVYFISNRIEKINFNIIKMFGIIFIFFFVSLASLLMENINIYLSLFIKIIQVIIMITITAVYYKEYTIKVLAIVKEYKKNK